MTVEDNPVAASRDVTFRVEHGVLIAKIRAKSLIHQLATDRIRSAIFEHLTEATSAVLVDCSELTLQVSSVFLSMLFPRLVTKNGLRNETMGPIVVCGTAITMGHI